MAMTRLNYDNLSQTPRVLPGANFVSGKFRALMYEQIGLGSDVVASYQIGQRIPIGAVVAFGVLLTSVSLGSTTLAIGITGTTGKYRAAATFTATDTPTFFGVATAVGLALTAAEDIQATLAAATGPASGTLHIWLFGTLNN